MIGKIKSLIDNLRLKAEIRSAIKNKIIVETQKDVFISREIFAHYVQNMKPSIKDLFVDKIKDMVIEAKMRKELEEMNFKENIDKVKEFFL